MYLELSSRFDAERIWVVDRHAVTDLYYPFEQTSGIGEQNQWLGACVEQAEAVMPYSQDFQDQSSSSEFRPEHLIWTMII